MEFATPYTNEAPPQTDEHVAGHVATETQRTPSRKQLCTWLRWLAIDGREITSVDKTAEAVGGPQGPSHTNGANRSVAQSVAEILKQHVTLEVEGIDRMYLNVYVPRLQTVEGGLGFLKKHRGHRVASTWLVEPLTRQFVAQIEASVREQGIPLIRFEKGQRKDEVAAQQRSLFTKPEGVVFVGKAQEKCTVYRTEKRRNPKTGRSYAWIVKSSALVNHYYFYCVDRDFGPFFLKFCSYFPSNAKLCLNGHEYAKRQLQQHGIAYQALDNGVLSCQDPQRLQAICDALSAEKIEALLRKWLAVLPHPFEGRDRDAGYRYDLSLLQAEFSLTQVLDRPVTGRIFLEEVIRENLDLGRPKQIQLIFDRKVTKTTPGPFRTLGHYQRSDSLVARGLQGNPHQAVPQRGPRAAHRNHHQQHPRLLHRPADSQSARATADRLSSQPPSSRSTNHQSRLSAGRGSLSENQPSHPGRPTARGGFAFCRSSRASLVERVGLVSVLAGGVFQPRSAPALESVVGVVDRAGFRRLHEL